MTEVSVETCFVNLRVLSFSLKKMKISGENRGVREIEGTVLD